MNATSITEIAQGTERQSVAVTSMATVAEEVRKLAEGSNQAAKQIAVGSRGLAEKISHIDRESKANSAETLTISAVSEEQSASMQEVASASQVLANISYELQNIIIKFKV